MLDPELRKAPVCQPLSPRAKEPGLGWFPPREGCEPLCGPVYYMPGKQWTVSLGVKTFLKLVAILPSWQLSGHTV